METPAATRRSRSSIAPEQKLPQGLQGGVSQGRSFNASDWAIEAAANPASSPSRLSLCSISAAVGPPLVRTMSIARRIASKSAGVFSIAILQLLPLVVRQLLLRLAGA